MPLTAAEQQELAALKAELARRERGATATPERTPPTDPPDAPERDDLGMGELTPSGSGPVSAGDRAGLQRLLAQALRYGPAVFGPKGLVAGALVSGAGSIAGDLVEGQVPSLSGSLMSAGGHLGGGVLGKGIEGGVHLASKLRPRTLGGQLEVYAQRDAAEVGKALEKATPDLSGAASVEDLQALMRGGVGKARIKETYRQSLEPVKKALTQAERDAGYSAYVGSDARKLEELLEELTTAGASAYNAAKGELRNAAGTPAALRSREEILHEIQALVPPAEWEGLRAAMTQYGVGKELLRWFKNSGRTGHPLGPNGLNMAELQRIASDRQGNLAERLPPKTVEEIMRLLFRGGRPPVADSQVKIPLSIGGGFRLPVPLDYLAGPGVRIHPYGQRAGAGLGVGLGSTLGR